MSISFFSKNNVNAMRKLLQLFLFILVHEQIELNIFIEPGCQLVGNIKGAVSVIVQGEMQGTIEANNNVLISGIIKGDIKTTGLVYLAENASVEGDISYGSIIVETGSKLLGLEIPNNTTYNKQNTIKEGLSYESKNHKHDGNKIPIKSTSEELLHLLDQKAINNSQQKLFSGVNYSMRTSNFSNLNAKKLSILGFSIYKTSEYSIEIMWQSALNNNIRIISLSYYAISIILFVIGIITLSLYLN